ncbi:50S ribosomal protein L29 [Streptomyces hirsutus]
MSAGTKASELRELGDEELLAKLREAKEELFNLRFQAAIADSSRTTVG